MKTTSLFLILALIPFASFAGEKVKGTTYFVVDEQNWETGEGTGYWIWHGKGVSNSVEGPLGTNPVECHGAGFWDKEGSWGEGICVYPGKTDSRVSHWWRERGQKVGQWKALTGTGKYAGIKGEGTYVSKQLPEGRHMSEWEGVVTLMK